LFASQNLHDIALTEKYDELVKEVEVMHRNIQRLETELENAKEEALRKKEEVDHSVTDAEPGDLWTRFGSNNMVCYAPVAALSYWRRWRGRPSNVHTS
jgi:hypothetical protein